MTLTAAVVRERVRGTLLERVGGTPLVPLRNIGRDAPGELWAKLETLNPAGSVKDRPALWMTIAAEEEGRLRAGRTILEATSGNTGVALALVGAVRGHPVELVMADRVSLERKRMAAAFGATIMLTDPLEGTDGAIREARRRAAEKPDRYEYLDQYSNPANPLAHELTTGPEIWEQTEGRVTHFVAGVGTSGTIVGVSAALRPRGVRIVAAQPAEPFHGLEGWKHMATAMRPALWNEDAADVHLMIPTDAALEMTHRLAREEGIFCGPSGGGAVVAAMRVARSEAGRIVALIADGGERYLSTALWE
jgi:cysteine synthase B